MQLWADNQPRHSLLVDRGRLSTTCVEKSDSMTMTEQIGGSRLVWLVACFSVQLGNIKGGLPLVCMGWIYVLSRITQEVA